MAFIRLVLDETELLCLNNPFEAGSARCIHAAFIDLPVSPT